MDTLFCYHNPNYDLCDSEIRKKDLHSDVYIARCKLQEKPGCLALLENWGGGLKYTCIQ